MADRTCTACGAVAGPRLKFCRECGARVEDGPAGAAAASPAEEGVEPGDATVIGAAPVRAPETTPVPSIVPAPPPPPDDDGEQKTAMVGDAPAAASAAPAAPAADPAGSGDETIIAGTLRAPAAAPPRSAPTPTPTADPAPPLPPPPPPPRPEPPREEPAEPEPVTDDFDVGDDDSGSTLAQASPPPPPPGVQRPTAAPFQATPDLPPAPPAPPAPAGTLRLEHWSPKVKSDFVNLAKAETVVGRDRGDLQYPEDNYLSKKHARFFRDPQGRLLVEDLGSLNGTYIRLQAPRKLEHRDVLYLGRHSFRFELLQYEEQDDRTIEGDPLTRVQGVQGTAPRARLVKRQEEGYRGLPFFFGTQRYVLGRSDGTHNFQRDDLMSRRHAALFHKDGDYWMEDLGSQNGTFLRLRGPHPLASGDVLKMGDQYFKMA